MVGARDLEVTEVTTLMHQIFLWKNLDLDNFNDEYLLSFFRRFSANMTSLNTMHSTIQPAGLFSLACMLQMLDKFSDMSPEDWFGPFPPELLNELFVAFNKTVKIRFFNIRYSKLHLCGSFADPYVFKTFPSSCLQDARSQQQLRRINLSPLRELAEVAFNLHTLQRPVSYQFSRTLPQLRSETSRSRSTTQSGAQILISKTGLVLMECF